MEGKCFLIGHYKIKIRHERDRTECQINFLWVFFNFGGFSSPFTNEPLQEIPRARGWCAGHPHPTAGRGCSAPHRAHLETTKKEECSERGSIHFPRTMVLSQHSFRNHKLFTQKTSKLTYVNCFPEPRADWPSVSMCSHSSKWQNRTERGWGEGN